MTIPAPPPSGAYPAPPAAASTPDGGERRDTMVTALLHSRDESDDFDRETWSTRPADIAASEWGLKPGEADLGSGGARDTDPAPPPAEQDE